MKVVIQHPPHRPEDELVATPVVTTEEETK